MTKPSGLFKFLYYFSLTVFLVAVAVIIGGAIGWLFVR